MLDLDLLTLLRARTQPILLTCRSVSEGGRWPDQDPRRRLVLLEAVKRGYDYVDVEHHSGFYDVMMEKTGRGLVISHHDFEGMPDDLDGLYDAMAEQGADVVKIAVTPRSIADVGRASGLRRARGRRRRARRWWRSPWGRWAWSPASWPAATARPSRSPAAAGGNEAAPGQIPAALLADLYRAREITPRTAVYGVLGSDVVRQPLAASCTTAPSRRAASTPSTCRCRRSRSTPFMHALPALELSGFSVTRPYKVEILPYLDEVDEAAARLRQRQHRARATTAPCTGSTTDGAGCWRRSSSGSTSKGRRW